MGRRGSLLVEAAFTLSILSLALALGMEMVVRTYRELVVHRACFIGTRARAIGLSLPAVTRKVKRITRAFLSEKNRTQITVEDRSSSGRTEVSVEARYPSIMSFELRGKRKHHFQFKRQCRFSLSR